MALPSDSYAEGMGSISELFPLCPRENSAGFSAAESATHLGVLLSAAKPRRGEWGLLVLPVLLKRPGAGQESQCLEKVWMW